MYLTIAFIYSLQCSPIKYIYFQAAATRKKEIHKGFLKLSKYSKIGLSITLQISLGGSLIQFRCNPHIVLRENDRN